MSQYFWVGTTEYKPIVDRNPNKSKQLEVHFSSACQTSSWFTSQSDLFCLPEAQTPDLPFPSCGRTTPERDSWTTPCSRRWRYSGQDDTGPRSARSWPAHPGRHDDPETGVNSGDRWTRPALKALRMAWECYSNQRRKKWFLDPDWPVAPILQYFNELAEQRI